MEDSGWHLDKRVSWGHIVTTLSVAVAMIVWLTEIQSRVNINETNIQHNATNISRVENAELYMYEEIIRRLERIDDRLSDR